MTYCFNSFIFHNEWLAQGNPWIFFIYTQPVPIFNLDTIIRRDSPAAETSIATLASLRTPGLVSPSHYPNLVKCSFTSAYGRLEMSTTARLRASSRGHMAVPQRRIPLRVPNALRTLHPPDTSTSDGNLEVKPGTAQLSEVGGCTVSPPRWALSHLSLTQALVLKMVVLCDTAAVAVSNFRAKILHQLEGSISKHGATLMYLADQTPRPG